MAPKKMAPKVKKKIESSLPGWKVQKSRPVDAEREVARPDQIGPNDQELKRKYLPGKSGYAADARAKADNPEPSKGKNRFERVVEKQAKDAAVGTKTVLVDAATGKVKAAQG